MLTNVSIDNRLLKEAQKAGKHRTHRETVNAALSEYVQRRKQLGIIKLLGKIDYDENYDYKRQRWRQQAWD